ncbi:MAG: hypothetical protein N2663_04160 [Chlorobi bacterium]|nr:hypothetical protein [Chlorobiota bacterium]
MADEAAIVVHPAVVFYRCGLVQLQLQLRDVLSQWFYAVVEQRPLLLDRYAALFGELEHQLQVETLRASMLRRLCELVQLYRRRGEAITPELLRRMCQLVEREYRNYRQGVMSTAATTRGGTATRESERSFEMSQRARQCVDLYRDLVKRLHPDREGDTDLFERYWNIMQQAYEAGDLERLRTVHGIVCIESQFRVGAGETLEGLQRTYRRLLYRLDYERRRLVRLQQQEPWVFAEQLDDLSWIARRRTELEQLIERQRRVAELAIEQLHESDARNWQEYLSRAYTDEVPDDMFADEFFRNTYFSSVRG